MYIGSYLLFLLAQSTAVGSYGPKAAPAQLHSSVSSYSVGGTPTDGTGTDPSPFRPCVLRIGQRLVTA